MTLSHQRMTRQTLAPEQVGTQVTVTQVVVLAKAVDLIGICKENSYIMKHGCLLDEWGIGTQFGVRSHNLQGLVGDKAAVQQKQIPEGLIVRVILVNHPHPQTFVSYAHLNGLITKLYE
jgi:hypothetical protein